MQSGTRTFEYVGSTQRLHQDSFLSSGGSPAYTFSRTYAAYDGLGNVTSITGSSQPDDIELTESFSYDSRNRLASWTKGTARSYAYDELGNLTQHAGAAQTFNDPDRPHALKQRADGATYSYDADGNITSIGGGGSKSCVRGKTASGFGATSRTPAPSPPPRPAPASSAATRR